jgi:dihydroorotate dehydrogenase
MGLIFPHAIGLAAGFDVNGEYIDALAKLGFAFIEVGGVTPHAQKGNPKPRVFRLPEVHALINRIGFSNEGIDALVMRIKKIQYGGILGVNIGKNKRTALEHAAQDYMVCMQKIYTYASYITINISSPNMPNLRDLQQAEYFFDLMNQLREEQLHLADVHGKYVPLVVKLSPDESNESLKRMANVLVSLGIDGIIATNTTVSRDTVHDLQHGLELGGLSGRPLTARATQCLYLIKSIAGDDITLIGVGGIDNAKIARERIDAGASLLQVYSGLVYEGPSLIKNLVEAL